MFILMVCSLLQVIHPRARRELQKWWTARENMFAPTQTFALQITHPNNVVYLSPEDEQKYWLYAAILTLYRFQDVSGFMVLGF